MKVPSSCVLNFVKPINNVVCTCIIDSPSMCMHVLQGDSMSSYTLYILQSWHVFTPCSGHSNSTDTGQWLLSFFSSGSHFGMDTLKASFVSVGPAATILCVPQTHTDRHVIKLLVLAKTLFKFILKCFIGATSHWLTCRMYSLKS